MAENAKLEQTYADLELLLEHGDAETVANACDNIVADFENETRAWFLGSKAYQELNRPDYALKNIETALLIEPSNLDFYFQLFNVLIQLQRDFEIGPRINAAFPKIAESQRDKFVGYIEKALETGLVHRSQLTVDVATAVLRVRNRD